MNAVFKIAGVSVNAQASVTAPSKSAKDKLKAHEALPRVRDTFAAIHRSNKFSAQAAYATFGNLKPKK